MAIPDAPLKLLRTKLCLGFGSWSVSYARLNHYINDAMFRWFISVRKSKRGKNHFFVYCLLFIITNFDIVVRKEHKNGSDIMFMISDESF